MRSLQNSISASWVEKPEKEIALREGLEKSMNPAVSAQAGVFTIASGKDLQGATTCWMQWQ